MCYSSPTFSGYRIFLTCLFLASTPAFAQTLLYPGDLAVVSLAANTGDGSGSCIDAAGTDMVSLVAFRDIATGTVLDLTDNGWERSNVGLWGNREGFLRVTRTGPDIPAGQIIAFRFPPVGNGYEAVAPDAGWLFEDLGTTSVNFNSNGDQLFFLQGGAWDNGSAEMDDATYMGGRLVFAFNSQTTWLPMQNTATDSGLPTALSACYTIQSATTTGDFMTYGGDTASAGRLEWLERLSNPENWQRFDQCSDFMPFSAALTLRRDTIGLECSTCGACEWLEDVISVRLPKVGGPFTVSYTVGRDTFRLEDIEDGFQLEVQTEDTLILSILEVQDSAGCSVYSELGDTLTLIAHKPPVVYEIPDQTSCGPFTLQGIIGENLSGAQGYFTGRGGTGDRLEPGDILSSNATLYIYDRLYSCETETQFDIRVYELPEASIGVLSAPGCSDPEGGSLELYTSGNGPFSIFWNKEGFDGLRQLDNLAAGVYEAEVVDANGCQAVAKITLEQSPDPLLSCRVVNAEAGSANNEGRVVLVFAEGAAPYSLSWTGPVPGALTLPVADSLILEKLPAGQYSVFLEDGNGCQVGCDFEILSSDNHRCTLEAQLTVRNATCTRKGGIDLTLSGGTLPLSFDWSVEGLSGLSVAGALDPGYYGLTITDASDCEQVLEFYIGDIQLPKIAYELFQPACSEEATGTFLIQSLQSGTMPLVLVNEENNDSILVTRLPHTISGLAPGTYQWTLTDAAGCSEEIAFNIEPAALLNLDLGPDRWISSGDSVILGEALTMAGTASWTPINFLSHPDQLRTAAFPSRTIDYTLTVTTPEGCIYSDEISIRVNEFRDEVFVPNAFSPDNDGNNDRFSIFGSSKVKKINRLKIFNRWGELLFDKGPISPSDPSGGWDGKHDGIIQPIGVYIYMAEVQFEGEVTEWVSGDFLLVR